MLSEIESQAQSTNVTVTRNAARSHVTFGLPLPNSDVSVRQEVIYLSCLSHSSAYDPVDQIVSSSCILQPERTVNLDTIQNATHRRDILLQIQSYHAEFRKWPSGCLIVISKCLDAPGVKDPKVSIKFYTEVKLNVYLLLLHAHSK